MGKYGRISDIHSNFAPHLTGDSSVGLFCKQTKSNMITRTLNVLVTLTIIKHFCAFMSSGSSRFSSSFIHFRKKCARVKLKRKGAIC